MVFKQQYLNKLQHLKSIGQKQETVKKLHEFIEMHKDELYKNRKMGIHDLEHYL